MYTDVPIVEVLLIPEGPVKESEESNVTLFCNVLEANPLLLTKVRWYANSTLLKELPDCEETRVSVYLNWERLPHTLPTLQHYYQC